MSLAIASAAGAFRGAFVHGVLWAFEREAFQAEAYAAASSSVIAAGYSALGKMSLLGGAEYWTAGLAYYQAHGHDASQMVLNGIRTHSPALRRGLFQPGVPSFLIATSAVVTAEAAQLTQGDEARRLGRKLLLATRTRDRSWADEHLKLCLFGTCTAEPVLSLTPDNLEAVAYASTRMLHAWRLPAEVDGRPYVDASYTCSCPAVEMAELGFDQVIAIVPEVGTAYRDLFQSRPIPLRWGKVPIHMIQPDVSLDEVGVGYASATAEGLESAFRCGEAAGTTFLKRYRPARLSPSHEELESRR